MVFSMASMPMTVGSRLMFSNTFSNVSQQMSMICSPSKYWWAAMSWNDPGTPCMAILFIFSSFGGVYKQKFPLHYMKRELDVNLLSV